MTESKVTLPPDTILYPLPCVLLTSAHEGKENILTLAWTGVVNSVPPMVSVSIRPSRFSHGLVEKSRQFAINVPTAALLEAVDFCGTVSGREIDKFKEAGLTPLPGQVIGAPIIAECPVSLECALRETLRLGSHDMFIGEVLAVRVNGSLVKEGKRLDFGPADPLAYFPGVNQYRRGDEVLARYGFSGGKSPGKG